MELRERSYPGTFGRKGAHRVAPAYGAAPPRASDPPLPPGAPAMTRLATSLVLAAALVLPGCSRKVTVQTAPAAAVEVSLRVTNNTAQSITVFVTTSGTEYTLGQVAPNATVLLPVRDVRAGSRVRLRAALADGSRSYTRDGVTLTGVFEWRVP